MKQFIAVLFLLLSLFMTACETTERQGEAPYYPPVSPTRPGY